MKNKKAAAWPAAVAAAALVVGGLLCLPDLLMCRYRSFYRAHFPEVVSRWALDGRFTAIAPFDDPDSNAYAGRVREAAGHAWPGDPYVKENASPRLATLDSLSFAAMGALVRATGDVSRGWLAARFLGTALWVIGLYLLLFELSGNRTFSLACAVALALFYDLWIISPFETGVGPWLSASARHVLWLLGGYAYNFGAMRLPEPALTYPPLFFASWLAIRAAKSGSRVAAAAAGVLGGLLAYVHTNVWSTYLLAMLLFAGLRGWQRAKHQPELFLSLIISAAISLPWVLHNYPVSQDVLLRSGVEYTRAWAWIGVLYIAGAAACLRYFRNDEGLLFGGCVLAAVAAALEVQCLTGYTVMPEHWLRIGQTFAFIVGAGWLGRRLGERRDWLWAAAAAALLALGRGVGYAGQRYPYQGLPGDVEGAFEYLDRSAAPDSVVAALGAQEAMLLPIYTHCKTLFGTGFLLASDWPTEGIVQRFRRALELFGVPEEDYLRRMRDAGDRRLPDAAPGGVWRGEVDWRSRELVVPFAYFMPAASAELFGRLRGTAPDRAAEVDYLWVGPFERELMPPAALRRLGEPVYRNRTIALYRR